MAHSDLGTVAATVPVSTTSSPSTPPTRSAPGEAPAPKRLSGERLRYFMQCLSDLNTFASVEDAFLSFMFELNHETATEEDMLVHIRRLRARVQLELPQRSAVFEEIAHKYLPDL